MNTLLSCPQGHQWQQPLDMEAADRALCPHCGLELRPFLGVTNSGQTAPPAGSR